MLSLWEIHMSVPMGTAGPGRFEDCRLPPFIPLPAILSLAVAQMDTEEAQLEMTSVDSVGGFGGNFLLYLCQGSVRGPQASLYGEERQA